MEQRKVTAQELGQTTAEYAVVLTMITVGIVAAFTLVGNAAASIVTAAASAL